MNRDDKTQTRKQLKNISELPFPEPDSLPEDIQKYMSVCQEKLGFIPNVIKAFSLRPEKLRTFISKYNELMLTDDTTLTRLEREMIRSGSFFLQSLCLLYYISLTSCARVF